ncbi:MAG: TIGR00282 family metallophosphoesterase [Bacilli bacterium]
MKILFIGDVVGSSGRQQLFQSLPVLKKQYMPDYIIVNGENAASGKGITEKIYKEFIEAGAAVVTLGNHAWDKREVFDFIDDAKYLVRPANFPDGTPGTGICYVKSGAHELAVINLQGRTFLPPLDCPFRAFDTLYEEAKKRTPFVFVDFHAEATSEKEAMGYYCAGRAIAVVGTHTHVPTADMRVLQDGTAYVTDVGMTGPIESILGVEKEAVIKKFLTSLPVRFEVAGGETELNSVLITVDNKTAKATAITRVTMHGELLSEVQFKRIYM